MSDRKKLNMYEKHDARVYLMTVSMALFWAIIFGIFYGVLEFVFKVPEWVLSGGEFGYGMTLTVTLMMMWKSNVRFGWVENIIEGKNKYPNLDAWLVKLTEERMDWEKKE